MKVLDLFCCNGGAGEGYRRAGFQVTGVDRDVHDYPPGEFVQADIMDDFYALVEHMVPDLIHLSPPCQGYSTMTGAAQSRHPRLIEPLREMLADVQVPYILENVQGAKAHMIDPVMLCGSTFGLRVRRHRLFESSLALTVPACDHAAQGPALGVYGRPEQRQYFRPDGTPRNRKASGVDEAREAMGMSWGTWKELTEAIPPAFTEYLGRQAADLLHLGRVT